MKQLETKETEKRKSSATLLRATFDLSRHEGFGQTRHVKFKVLVPPHTVSGRLTDWVITKICASGIHDLDRKARLCWKCINMPMHTNRRSWQYSWGTISLRKWRVSKKKNKKNFTTWDSRKVTVQREKERARERKTETMASVMLSHKYPFSTGKKWLVLRQLKYSRGN